MVKPIRAPAGQSAPDFSLEDSVDGLVCGIDEVGRGPWAGPVMAACVYIPPNKRSLLQGLNDSKKLNAAKRDQLAELIQTHCPYGFGEASVAEIDQHNILQATYLAMGRAFAALQGAMPQTSFAMAFIDGRGVPPALPVPSTPVIGGDAVCMSIAAASIIAKVRRDTLMAQLHAQHPYYGWDKNAGYGVKAHQLGLMQRGVSDHHRRSFAPIRKLLTPTS